MLGWFIIISTATPDEMRFSGRNQDKTLATWEAGIGGARWLRRLVEEGRAIELRADGYPCRYAALAKDVLPFLEIGPAPPGRPAAYADDWYTPAGRLSQLRIFDERVMLCAPDQLLSIDAWDQS